MVVNRSVVMINHLRGNGVVLSGIRWESKTGYNSGSGSVCFQLLAIFWGKILVVAIARKKKTDAGPLEAAEMHRRGSSPLPRSVLQVAIE